MGLDVKVYCNIEITRDIEKYSFMAFVINEKWLYKIKNLENGAFYNGDRIFYGISCGYSYHNRFRRLLLELIGREDLTNRNGYIKWDLLPLDMPFYDFIDFADNEGCLDWEISEKIYSDFAKFDSKAKEMLMEQDYGVYKTWTKTFLSAKDNKGVVVFS